MISWLAENADLISAAASIGMLAVWVTYLQVFLRSYRRQVQPKIVINRAAGTALDASCFVSNMSSDPIYLETILVTMRAGDDEWGMAVTDVEAINEDDDRTRDPRQLTHQGPLQPGEYTSLGSFRDILERVTTSNGGPDAMTLIDRAESVTAEIMIIADHASDDLLVGAKRVFALVRQDGKICLSPQTAHTQQIRSRRERRDIAEIIAKEI